MPDTLLPIATIPAVPVRTQDDQETFNDKTAALFTALQTSVAGYNANVPALNALSADASMVAAISADVTTLADIASDLTTVAGINANVTTVAGISASVTTVAGIQANVVTVAGISTDTTTVADISSDVTTVAGIRPAILTVSGVSASVTTVAGISTDIVSVAANSADITACADNMTAIVNAPTQAANAATSASNAATSASAAAQSAVDAAAIAGITVSETPAAGVTPKAYSTGQIDAGWLPGSVVVVLQPPASGPLPGETVFVVPPGVENATLLVQGAGLYVFDADSTEIADGATVLRPSTGVGRWLLSCPASEAIAAVLGEYVGAVDRQTRQNAAAIVAEREASTAMLTQTYMTLTSVTVPTNTTANKVVTIDGLVVGDGVIVSPEALPTGISCCAFVSAADTVTVRHINTTATAITVASQRYDFTVLRAR